MNPKTDIFKTKQGVDFVGYKHWYSHRKLRKSSIKRIKRKLKTFQAGYAHGLVTLDQINASVQSWLGHAKHADTYRLRKKILGSHVFEMSNQ